MTSPTTQAPPVPLPPTESPPLPPRRHRPPVLRILLVLIVVGAISAVLWWRWSSDTGPAPLTASGTVEATEINIQSEVTGRVLQVLAKEGDQVREGQELVQLDDSLLQLQYRQADAASQQVLREQIEKTVLHAPRDGTVIVRAIEPGEVATPGKTLLTIADLTNLDLTIYLLQRDIGLVEVGQQVVITTDSLPGTTFAGTVSSVATKAEFTPRNVQTQRDRLGLVFGVKVAVQSDGRLKAGMPVDARIVAR